MQTGECIQTQVDHCVESWTLMCLENAWGNKGRDRSVKIFVSWPPVGEGDWHS